MSHQLSTIAHLWDLPARNVWFVGAAVLALAIPAIAQGPAVMRIEQDWQLVLNEPNDGTYSPQFHTVMSPYPDLANFYAQVTWNYKEESSFEPGGLQLQNWMGGTLSKIRDLGTGSLSTTAETITWTQVLRTYGNVIRFYITNGQSTTWGQFGGYTIDSEIGVTNLNGYDTNVSVKNSWITYGSNRVNSLIITAVRSYDHQDDLVSEDLVPKVVFQFEDSASE